MPKPFQIIWGGADVDPRVYNRERSAFCGYPNKAKDESDLSIIRDCIANGIPIIGICRGAQILNVANGGILVQHIDGHAGRGHDILITDSNELPPFEVQVTSTHHQMMVAHQDAQVLGIDSRPTTGVHWDNVNDTYDYSFVNEVIYYPKTKSLCIQPHPEWMNTDSAFAHWVNRFVLREWGIGPIDFPKEEQYHLLGV